MKDLPWVHALFCWEVGWKDETTKPLLRIKGGGSCKPNFNPMINRLSNKKIFVLTFIHRSSISFASGSPSKAGPLVTNNYMTLLRQ